MTDRTDLRELLGAYALDAVDEGERRRVEALLADDAAARAELDEYRMVAAILAEAVEESPSTPSPLVWDRIRSAVGGEREAAQAPTFTPVREARRQRWYTRVSVAVSAVAVVVSVGLAARVIDLQDRVDETADLSALATAKIAEPGSEVVALTADGGVEVKVVVGFDGVGYVLSGTLPALDASRTYQLWAINDNGVISAGILGNDPGVAAFQVDGALSGLAITDEVAGGVASSENAPVAVWLRNA